MELVFFNVYLNFHSPNKATRMYQDATVLEQYSTSKLCAYSVMTQTTRWSCGRGRMQEAWKQALEKKIAFFFTGTKSLLTSVIAVAPGITHSFGCKRRLPVKIISLNDKMPEDLRRRPILSPPHTGIHLCSSHLHSCYCYLALDPACFN